MISIVDKLVSRWNNNVPKPPATLILPAWQVQSLKTSVCAHNDVHVTFIRVACSGWLAGSPNAQ